MTNLSCDGKTPSQSSDEFAQCVENINVLNLRLKNADERCQLLKADLRQAKQVCDPNNNVAISQSQSPRSLLLHYQSSSSTLVSHLNNNYKNSFVGLEHIYACKIVNSTQNQWRVITNTLKRAQSSYIPFYFYWIISVGIYDSLCMIH